MIPQEVLEKAAAEAITMVHGYVKFMASRGGPSDDMAREFEDMAKGAVWAILTALGLVPRPIEEAPKEEGFRAYLVGTRTINAGTAHEKTFNRCMAEATYTLGGSMEINDYDGVHPEWFDENTGTAYLPEGWWIEAVTDNGYYDGYFLPPEFTPTHFLPLSALMDLFGKGE